MYKCSNCDYVSKKYFGLCPNCKNGMAEETKENPIVDKGTVTNVTVPNYEIKPVSNDIKEDVVVKNTNFESFNKILSTKGGFVNEQVITIGAGPGTGKSTFCAQIADEDTLYITTEESYNQVNSRFLRVNNKTKAKILATTNLDVILDAISSTVYSFIIVDSLNNINNGADGYIIQAKNLSRIVSALKYSGKIGLITSQVTKNGEITGMNTILHAVDTVLYFERSQTNENIILYSNKNRFCEIGSIAMFKHTSNGLVEVANEENITEPEIGVSYAKAQFGFKSIGIRIEALVAPSSGNFGIRRVIGLNQSRIQQIIGILNYTDPTLRLTDKDVYVAVANGLTVYDPTLDLAIINAILSSCFKKESIYNEYLNGVVSLNGKITNTNYSLKTMIKEYKNI